MRLETAPLVCNKSDGLNTTASCAVAAQTVPFGSDVCSLLGNQDISGPTTVSACGFAVMFGCEHTGYKGLFSAFSTVAGRIFETSSETEPALGNGPRNRPREAASTRKTRPSLSVTC